MVPLGTTWGGGKRFPGTSSYRIQEYPPRMFEIFMPSDTWNYSSLGLSGAGESRLSVPAK